MSSYSSALVWMTLAAQVVAWPSVSLHQANNSLTRLPANDRVIVERLLRSQLGPLTQGEDTAQLNKAMAAFRVERLSLAGTPALAVQAAGDDICGAAGNCTFWIIDLAHRRILLRADAIQGYALDPVKPRGVPNIITATHESATEHEKIRWVFLNGRYERQSCVTEEAADSDGNPLPQPKTTPHPCSAEGN